MGIRITFVALALWSATIAASDTKTSTVNPHGDKFDPVHEVFATVDDDVITVQAYRQYLQQAMRRKFYHGNVPEERIKAFRKEMADELVERVLLVHAAKQKNIAPDDKAVESRLAALDKKNAGKPGWEKHREPIVKTLRQRWREESQLQVLEAQVKNIAAPAPDGKRVRGFYENNKQKFTTPERVRVSLILLKVAPSSGTPAWNAAREEGKRLVERLRKNSSLKNFAELARIHSADPSAEHGGDMGFVHQGMLAAPVYKVLEKMKVDTVSDAISILQGVAIFRLNERQPPKLNSFESVKERARDLWLREKQREAWHDYTQSLRSNAKVTINESYL